MSPRTGRPKSENPKEQKFSIRLDETTGKRLDDYCEENNQKRAVVIREALERFLDENEK